jgi:uncharacterized protein YndB with AHSA1/START domain
MVDDTTAAGPARIECERVGLDFFDTAPCKVVVSETVAASPERLFEVFLDADAWPRWAFPITKVEWTSPFPIDVGSTRTVHMRGGMVGWEEFIAWEPGVRMAFRFNQSVERGPRAFAEDYRLRPLPDGRTHLAWTMAMELPGFSGRISPAIAAAMWPANRSMVRRLRRLVESG